MLAMPKILITDSLFIFPEHEKQLQDAGYEVERLDKTEATEQDLIKAIKGKDGYILGGIERVTEKIIDAGKALRAIVFTGIGYKDFIPAWEYATQKGIAIANTPDGPTQAVTEWAIAAALLMTRGFMELGRLGDKTFGTTNGLENQAIGVVGLGRIGSHIAETIRAFKPANVSYFSRSRKPALETKLGIKYKDLKRLLNESDVIFLCVSKDAGENFFDKTQLSAMKKGSLLVSFMNEGIINERALFTELESGRIRAISDYPMSDQFNLLPLNSWYSFKGSNAFNTGSELKLTSDIATTTIIKLLKTGQDKYLVNPDYLKHSN